MTRDWLKVALAALAAAALGAVCSLDVHAQAAKPSAKNPKAPASSAKAPASEAKSEPAEADDNDEAEGKQAKEAKAAAKKKRQDPAEAQRAIEGATKLVQTGKVDQAVQSLSAVLAGGNLPPAIMAKALYARGLAYRQQGKPAQAISDLTSALWLKGGLPEAERADAQQQRAAAYRDAGLTERGEVVAAPSGAGAGDRTASPGKTAAQETPSGKSGGNWFSNLFNPQPAAPPPPASPPPKETASIQKSEPPPQTAPRAAPAPRIGSAWASTTQVKEEREPPPAAPRVPAAAPAPPPPPQRTAAAAPAPPTPPQRTAAAAPARPEGRFRVQLGAVRTQEEARALAAKAKREHGAALAAREPEIDQAVLGNMGSFYRVRIGPFATMQETQAVCAQLKGSGFDCMTVAQ